MPSSEWDFPPSDAAVLYTDAEAADEKKGVTEVTEVDASTPGAQPSDWAPDKEPDEGESEEMLQDLSLTTRR